MKTEKEAATLIQHLDGMRISIPISLIKRLGDLPAAAFLQQAAYLTSMKIEREKDGGWFDLPQIGDGMDDGNHIFERLGSWQSALGLSPDQQLSCRTIIESRAPGVLQCKRRGIPARLYYKVDLVKYLRFISTSGFRKYGRASDKNQGQTGKGAVTCPVDEIIDLYHQVCPGLPVVQVSRFSGSRAALDLNERWREGLAAGENGFDVAAFGFRDKTGGLAAFQNYFRLASESYILNGGDNDRWRANFSWLMRRDNFDKVLEGTL